MLGRLLALFGVDRLLSSFGEAVNDALVEGVSGFEARKELAKMEWAEEKVRLQRLFLFAVLFAVFLFLTLFFVSMAVLVTFWETDHRVTVAWGVALLWGTGFFVSFLSLRKVVQQGRQAFQYTRQELQEDLQTVKNQLR